MAKQTAAVRAELEKKAVEKVAKRQLYRTDKLALAELLGYDFQPDVHTDLVSNYLTFPPDNQTTYTQLDTRKNRLILWFRGAFKTSSIVVEVVQTIINFPDIRILLMQGTVKNTTLLLQEIRSHFDGTNIRSCLKDYFPEFCSDRRLGSKEKFTVPARTRTHLKESTVTVASPKSVKAGQHFDAGFFDDLVHEQNFRNPDLVAQAIKDFNLYSPLIDPGGYKYVTGTRYAFGDLYEWIIRQNKGEWIISLKAVWDEQDHTKLVFPRRTLTDGREIGHTVEALEQLQRDDAEMFAAQYLNRPISATAQLFTEELMLQAVKSANDKDFPALGPKVLVIDLATSGTNDDAVILCTQRDGYGRKYITDARGGRFTVPVTAIMVLEMALIHRPLQILIERSAAGVVFLEYLKVVARDKNLVLPLDFIKIKNSRDAKFVRIASVSGELKAGKLFFLTGLPCWEKMMEEFLSYTAKSQHDDYPDTVALACQFWDSPMMYIAPVKYVHPMFATFVTTDPTQSVMDRAEFQGCGSEFADF